MAKMANSGIAQATALGCGAKLVESRFQTLQKTLMHRLFLGTSIGTARQHKRLGAVGAGH